MSQSHTDKYLRFRGFLTSQQKDCNDEVDIRSKVLGLRESKLTIGYVESSLKSGNGANLRLLFPNSLALDNPNWKKSQNFLITGNLFEDEEHSHRATMRLFNEQIPLDGAILFELGFLASTHSWSHAFKSGDPKMACLGYVYDDLAHYYMADYPNRLIRKLNSDDEPTEDEIARSRRLIERIVQQRISKYNAQPMEPPALRQSFTRRVLVCDQSFADASTLYGKIDEAGFERMLLSAIQENPGAEIIVKSHPDTSWEKEKRVGYYSHLQSTGRIRILREPVNPFTLFELVDTVYVGSSQLGLEALFAGKKVVCFGAPFYSGWGLTDDRQPIPHRHRSRTLEEVFHYFYIWYTIYHVPGYSAPSQIEDVLDFIEENRPFSLPCAASDAEETPKVSIVIPVYGVENYIEKCITSVQKQTLRDIEIIPVNDCSPDASQDIIDRLATHDARIRPILLDKNVGQGFARNEAIKAARGDYVWFLDGDDWLENPRVLSELYNRAISENFDMVRGRKAYEAIFVGDELVEKKQDRAERFFEDDVYRTTYADTPNILNNRHFWVWLYRREFLLQNDIHFRTTQWEERAFLVKALVNAEKISLRNIDSTAYRIRVGSTARRVRTARDFELMLQNFKFTLDTLLDAGAGDASSPLREHLRYNVSQLLAQLVDGEAYRFAVSEGPGKRDAFIKSVKQILEHCQVSPDEVLSEFVHNNKSLARASAYPLIAASILAERADILDYVINREPIPQDKLYEVTLKETQAATPQRDLQTALNTYARNERVTIAKPEASKPFDKPRIVVHIGSTKTGSTYIQHLLEQNRPELMRNGVWYPEVGLFWQESRPHKQAGHAGVVPYIVSDDRFFLQYIERGLQLMEGRIHTIVLSSEAYFLQKNAHKIPEYFSGYDVEMIVYLRDQVEWANAQYCEFVAGGAIGRVEDPISNWLESAEVARFLDYRNVLNAWASTIEREKITIRLFQKSELIDNDLVTDFSQSTDLELLTRLPMPSKSQTNSVQLSGPHVELIRSYNSRPFRTKEAYLDFIEEATTGLSNWRKSRDLPMPKPWLLTPDNEDWIRSACQETNANIAQLWLGRSTGTLFGGDKAKPAETALYQDEIAIVSKAYDRFKPVQELEAEPMQNAVGRSKILVNYGIFGWRLWLLSPVLRRVWKNRLTPQTKAIYKRNPARFAREKWTRKKRDKLIVDLIFPDWNVMGPFGVLRAWRPIVRPVLKSKRHPERLEQFDADPVLFARNQDNKLHRIVGRLLYPMGELREK